MSLLTFPPDPDRPAVLRRAHFWQERATMTEDETLLLMAYRRASEAQRRRLRAAADVLLNCDHLTPVVTAEPKAEGPIESYERQVQENAEKIRLRCQPTADTALDGILTARQLARLRTIGPAQTLGDAAQHTEDELSTLPYVGHGLILKLTRWLRAAGLTFRAEGDHAGDRVGA